MGGPRREQGVVLSFVSNDDVQEQPAQRGARGRKASVVALIGALALAGAAVGAVFFARGAEDDGASADTDPESDSAAFADLVGGGVSATAVESDVVWGRAKLNLGNKLEWVLRGLEQNSQGTVHLHTGKSCDDVGPSLWYAEAGVNPWSSVVWTSNHKGKSTGTVEINSLDGAYSFAGNLKHAVVFYSEAEEVLACGILNTKSSYRKYGVRSSLNGGFAVHHSELTAGEVILSKNNKLSWGLHNLGADQVGALEVLAGRDCSDPSNTWLSMEWQSNAYGVSEGDVSLGFDEYDFSELVDRAVAVRDADGAVVVCDMLSGFVESTTEALEAIEMELRDIEDTIKSEQDEVTPAPTQGPSRSLEPTIPYEVTNPPTNEPTAGPVVSPTMPPTLPPVPPTPVPTDAPVITPTTSVPPTPVPTDAPVITPTTSVPPTPVPTDAPVTTPTTSVPPTPVPTESTGESTVATIEPILGQGYICLQTAVTFTDIKSEIFTLRFERDRAAQTLTRAQTAESYGNATQVQLDFIANYSVVESDILQRLEALDQQVAGPQQVLQNECLSTECRDMINDVQRGRLEMDDVVDTLKAICPLRFLCEPGGIDVPGLDCPVPINCDSRNYTTATSYFKLVDTLETKASMRLAYENALERQKAGIPQTQEDQNALLYYSNVDKDINFQKSMIAHFTLICTFYLVNPSGTVSLDNSGLLQWDLQGPKGGQSGTIKIHEGTTCDPLNLGEVYSAPNTTPFDTVTWSESNQGLIQGNVSLSDLEGALTFEDYKNHAVVVYDPSDAIQSCGILN